MTRTADHAQREIARNVAIHDRIARKYDARHGEIFNPIEQDRLHRALARARDAVQTGREPLHALDFGCGSGNLTRHLLELGFTVTAADVSQGFLDLVRSRYPTARLETLLMPGGDLSGVPDAGFDLVATYSVLHHIPDYLGAVAELARLTRPGGVVYIDHEQNEAYWQDEPAYRAFRAEAERFDWRKYLTPSNYWHRLLRAFDPRHSNEGDIHVWPDDHIEWDRIVALLAERRFEVVLDDDYLLSRRLYRPEVYARHVGRCTDTKAMAFRRRAQA